MKRTKLQLHMLRSFGATLLNRDEEGLAKRISFGTSERLRISSQCLKKHLRDAIRDTLSTLPQTVRSRLIFRDIIYPNVVAAGVVDETAKELVLALMKLLKVSPKDDLSTGELVVMGKPEIDYISQELVNCAQTGDDIKTRIDKKSLKALAGGFTVGVDAALFGRFTAGDTLSRGDAAVAVAHSIGVSAVKNTMDDFTAIDDLNQDHHGAAHMNQADLGAGIFYEYMAIDLPCLVSNLTGCQASEWETNLDYNGVLDVLEELLKAAVTVSPGAKIGSTAPYSRPFYVLMELGEEQPCQYVDAFLQAIRFDQTNEPKQNVVSVLEQYIADYDGMYGNEKARVVSTLVETNLADAQKMTSSDARKAILELLS